MRLLKRHEKRWILRRMLYLIPSVGPLQANNVEQLGYGASEKWPSNFCFTTVTVNEPDFPKSVLRVSACENKSDPEIMTRLPQQKS